MNELNRQRVLELFTELSQRLAAVGSTAQLFVVGGAAMALAYDRDRLTRDVDALFVPAPEVRQAAEEVAASRGLAPDWLNDAVKGFLPGADSAPQVVFETEALLVQVASPGYLLAMKIHAARDDRDLDDAAWLVNILGYNSSEECLEQLTRIYTDGQLLPRHRCLVDEVFARSKMSK